MNYLEILNGLMILMYRYGKVARASVTRDRFDLARDINDMQKLILRETLTEHVGQLPIVATYMYQYIEHKAEINLPSVLVMLAIHDIAETRLGDVPTSLKNVEQEKEEIKLTKELIDPSLINYYEEFELTETMTAKFAKGVDTLAVFINDLLLPPKAMVKRLDDAKLDLDKIFLLIEKRFVWDETFKNIFKVIDEEYRNRLRGISNIDIEKISDEK